MLPDELFREIYSYVRADVLSGLSPVVYYYSTTKVFQVEKYPERGLRIHKCFCSRLGTILRIEKYRRPKTSHGSRLSLWIWRNRRFLYGYSRTSLEDDMTRHRQLPDHLKLQYRFLE